MCCQPRFCKQARHLSEHSCVHRRATPRVWGDCRMSATGTFDYDFNLVGQQVAVDHRALGGVDVAECRAGHRKGVACVLPRRETDHSGIVRSRIVPSFRKNGFRACDQFDRTRTSADLQFTAPTIGGLIERCGAKSETDAYPFRPLGSAVRIPISPCSHSRHPVSLFRT